MAGGQCSACGAPVRGRYGEECSYCGTPVPTPSATLDGPAGCVCGVLATWHCETCDAPICDQHRARYCPGLKSRKKHLANGNVEAIWRGSAELDAAELRAGAHQLCTVCRPETAETLFFNYAATTEKPP